MSEDREEYRIGHVSRLTGLPAATIRFWESKYGLLSPARQPNGYRVYSQKDIDEILSIRDRLRGGRSSLKLLSYAKLDPAHRTHAEASTGIAPDHPGLSLSAPALEALERLIHLARESTGVEGNNASLRAVPADTLKVIGRATGIIAGNSQCPGDPILALASLLRSALKSDLCTIAASLGAAPYTAMDKGNPDIGEICPALEAKLASTAAALDDSTRVAILEEGDLDPEAGANAARLKAAVVTSVQLARQHIGYIGAARLKDKHRFSDEDIGLVRIFANLVAVAARNVDLPTETVCGVGQFLDNDPTPQDGNLQAEVVRLNRAISAVSAVAEILTQSLELDDMLRATLDTVLDVLGVQIGHIYFVDESAGDLILKVYRGSPPRLVQEGARMKMGTGIAGRVAVSGEPAVVPNLSEDPRRVLSAVREEKLGSYMCVPLKSKRKVFGTMSAISYALRPFTPHDVQLLTTIGHQMGAAIENAYLNKQTLFAEREKIRDLREKLAEVARAQEQERRKLAAELHDGVAQILASLVGKMEADQAQQDLPEHIQARWLEYLTSVKDALDGLRKSTDSDDDTATLDYQIRTVIVDDQPLFRRAIADILRERRNIEVAAVANDGAQAIDLARSLQPDVILMDISLPTVDGIEATRAIVTSVPGTKVVLLSVHDEEKHIIAGLQAGAVGYVLKDCRPDEIVRAVEDAYRGDYRMSPSVASRLLEMVEPLAEAGDSRDKPDGLTSREVEVLKLVAAGTPAKQIANQLGITHKTVRTHISNIYHKLQIYDRAQVVLYALRKGMINDRC